MKSDRPKMQLDVRVGETFYLSGEGQVAVTLQSKSGQRARLEIAADPTVQITPPQQTSSLDEVRKGVTVKQANSPDKEYPSDRWG